jgi:hypothetical protein
LEIGDFDFDKPAGTDALDKLVQDAQGEIPVIDGASTQTDRHIAEMYTQHNHASVELPPILARMCTRQLSSEPHFRPMRDPRS